MRSSGDCGRKTLIRQFISWQGVNRAALSLRMHRDHEPSAARVGAQASWTRRRSLRSRRFGWVQRCRRWASGCYKAPNPKLQIPKKLQAPSSKTTRPSCWTRVRRWQAGQVGPGRLWDLKLGACLELGVSDLELGAWHFGIPSRLDSPRGLATQRNRIAHSAEGCEHRLHLSKKCLALRLSVTPRE
jgi:hypothetical protein